VQIKAVTFDVGGTLIEPWPSVGHVYAEVAGRHGITLSPDLLDARFKAAWNTRADFQDTRAWWEELVDDTFEGLVAQPPRNTFFPELFERFAQPGVWRVFNDVLPALDQLASRGVRLGILSNWDERLRTLLLGLNLSNYFETIVVSCEVGFSKPSPVIFNHAATKLGLPPADILHVGDSIQHDVLGARAAGFNAARIRRRAAEPHDGDLHSLTEVLEIRFREAF
jgi:putative hydrolase of the HAD superfamily